MSVGIDLPDNATHEDIERFVEAAMAPEPKDGETGDAKTSDTDTKTLAGDETPAGRDSVATEDKGGEDQGSKDEKTNQDWLDDDLRAEVSAMGIDESELSAFSSRDELERALRFLDSAAMKAGREAAQAKGKKYQEDQDDQEGEQGERAQQKRVRGKGGRFVASDSGLEKVEKNGETGYKPQLDLSEFDDGLGEKVNAEFDRMRDYYEGRLKAFDERFARLEEVEQQRQAEAVEVKFDAIVDSLGHKDLFGESGKESKQQLENRQKLFEASDILLAGLAKHGRHGTLDKSSVARAMRLVDEFADHLSKQERKNLTRKIERQSNLRQGGGAEKPSDAEESLEEYANRFIREHDRG